jgi:hypothetical protein
LGGCSLFDKRALRPSSMHRIATRSPSPEEQQVIAWRAKPDIASYGCLTIFLGIVPTLLLGMLGYWLDGIISDDAGKYGAWLGCLPGVILFVVALVWFVPYERRQDLKTLWPCWNRPRRGRSGPLNCHRKGHGDGSRRPCLHGERRNQPQFLLSRPAGRLNCQPVQHRGGVSRERRAIGPRPQVAVPHGPLEPLP